MKVLVYEHACGGGFAEGAVSAGFLAEGFGMLRLCVAGLKAMGCDVVVVVDEGLSRFCPPIEGDFVSVFNFRDAQQAILKSCVDVDAAYVIAPETGGVLHALVELLEQMGVPTFNSHSKAIAGVSDKFNLYETLKVNGVKTPKTCKVNVVEGVREVDVCGFGFPFVVKPVDGVGCGGLSVVEGFSQVGGAFGKIESEFVSEMCIVQEFLKGDAVSVSLLCTGAKVLPVSLNKQNVVLASPKGVSCYVGGALPFGHELMHEAFKTAEAAVNCFSGLKGYVGVDLVLTDAGPVVLDVNPRLTTSFVGLSSSGVVGFNFMEAIVNAALKNCLPSEMVFSGRYCCFSKVETPKVDLDFLDILYGVKEVVSPPFPILDSNRGCALVSVEGSSLNEAEQLLGDAKERLLNLL